MRLVYKERVLVLSALTRAMNRVGYKVHISHVSRVMRGEREASKDFLKALQKVLGYSYTEAKQFIKDCSEAIRYVEALPPLIEEE